MNELVIIIYGCGTKQKYINELAVLENTWGKHCSKFNIPKFVFLEETKLNKEEPLNYIHLPNVMDNYESNIPKTYLGLKWLIDNNIQFNYVLVLGTDSYPNVPKIVKYLSTLPNDSNLYIGNHGDYRNLFGKNYYFHSGGPGFILSKNIVNELYPYLAYIHTDWAINVSISYPYLNGAGDVAISYYLTKYGINYKRIDTPNISFSNCNCFGYPCHIGIQKPENVLSCHLMSPQMMELFTQLLENNNFYL